MESQGKGGRNEEKESSELVRGGDSEAAGTEWIVVVGDIHKLRKGEDINSSLKTIAWAFQFSCKIIVLCNQAMVFNVEFVSSFQ